MLFIKSCAAFLLAASLVSGPVFAQDSSQADIEKQLKEARQKLEDAARQVAELSAQMGRPLVDRLRMMGEGPHAIIGVQLDSGGVKDGAHVRDVSPGGPAAQAGMHAGDVIVRVNGKDVKGERASADVARLMRDVEPNSKVKIRVLRDGKTLDFDLTARPVENAWGLPGLPGLPEHMPFEDFGPDFMGGHGSVAGMQLATLTPQLGSYFGTDKGVLVLRAPRDSAFNLQDGDVILSIDGREPTSGSHATRILASYQPGEKIKMELMRQHKKTGVEAVMPSRHHHDHESSEEREEES
jgi:S1-C subfamily serine protease